MFNRSTMNTLYSRVTNAGIGKLKIISLALIAIYGFYAISLIQDFSAAVFETALSLFVFITFASAFNAWIQMNLDEYQVNESEGVITVFSVVIDVVMLFWSVISATMATLFITDVISITETVIVFHSSIALFYGVSMTYMYLLYIKFVKNWFSSVVVIASELIILVLGVCIAHNSVYLPFNLILVVTVLQVVCSVAGLVVLAFRRNKKNEK